MAKSETPHPLECALYHDLWVDRSWVHRRIDEITFTERGMMQVKSTFDLDVAHLRQRLNKLPKSLRCEGGQIALPLMALPRTLLLDIDVTLDGKAQSFAGKRTSADITNCIYLQEYFNKYIAKDNANNNFVPEYGWPSDTYDEIAYVSKLMRHWFEQGDGTYFKNEQDHNDYNIEKYEDKIIYLQGRKNGGSPVKEDFDGGNKKFAREVVKYKKRLAIQSRITASSCCSDIHVELWDYWSRFAEEDYIAIALIDLPNDRERSKLTFVRKTNPNYQHIFNYPLIRYSPILITCRSLLGSGVEDRYHFRVNAPDGHYISSLDLTDPRDNSKVLFRSNKKSTEIWSKVKEYSSIRCEMADGPHFTFLAIKDDTPQRQGNTLGHTIHIGVEPFPQTFMYRALVSVFFLLVCLTITRLVTFDIGKIMPFSVGALAFLASSPLWFRVGSEDAFTHRILKRGRSILGALATLVFVCSFVNQLANRKIPSSEQQGDLNKCSYVFDVYDQIFNEQHICDWEWTLSGKNVQNFADHSWELVFLLCTLYIFGILWFFTRTNIQKNEFKSFLSRINSTPLYRKLGNSYLPQLSRRVIFGVKSCVALSLLAMISCTVLLIIKSTWMVIFDTLHPMENYFRFIYFILSLIFFFFIFPYLSSLTFWEYIYKLLSAATAHRLLVYLLRFKLFVVSFCSAYLIFTAAPIVHFCHIHYHWRKQLNTIDDGTTSIFNKCPNCA
jgi:membrane protein